MIWWGTRRQEEGAGVTATQATVLDRTRPNKCDAAAVVFPWPPSQEGRGYNSIRRLCRDTTCIHCRRKYLSVFAREKSLFLRRKNSICPFKRSSQIECHLTCTSDFPIYHTRHHVWKNKHETEIHTLSVQLNPFVFFHISHVKYNISQIYLNICSFFAKEKYNIVFNTIERKVEDTWMQYK